MAVAMIYSAPEKGGRGKKTPAKISDVSGHDAGGYPPALWYSVRLQASHGMIRVREGREEGYGGTP